MRVSDTRHPGAAIPIDALARLARLALDDDERARHEADLARVVEMMAALASHDVAGVEPLAHALDATATLREDAVTETDASAALLARAPEAQGGYFIVPRVVE